MSDRSVLRLLAALAATVAVLTAAGCLLAGGSEYVNGSIDGTPHNKSGYTQASAGGGATVLLASGSMVDVATYNGLWSVTFWGSTTGSYSFPNSLVAYYVSSTGVYQSGPDIVVEVTTYTSAEVAGTFSGTFAYNTVGSHAVSGEFRIRF